MDDANLDPETTNPADVMRAANRREDFGGRRAGEYTHWIKEQMSWKVSCYLGDWSFLANLRLEGPDALDLLKRLSINSFDSYAVGGGKHLVQCNENGKVIGEGVLIREADDVFIVHGVPSYWTAYNLETGDYDASAEFRDTFNYGVQGPKSLAVLEKVSDGSLRDIDFMHTGALTIKGHEVTAARFGMSGEVGFELHGPAEYAQNVYDAIYEAGREFGIQRLSVKTSSINQLEAGIASRIRDYVSAIFDDELAEYRAWLRDHMHRDLITHPVEGSFQADDISAWYRSPVELGWGRYMTFSHDFIGREVLEEEVDSPERTLVTLEWDDEDVIDVYASLFRDGDTNKYMDMPHQQKRAMVADQVLLDGEPVGVATMRGYSYFFRQMLSLGVLDVEHTDPGTEVTVVWGEGRNPVSPTVEDHVETEIQATVAETPYKTDNRGVDLSSYSP
jgi:vanillate/3-O-methylgallate O-demethylase